MSGGRLRIAVLAVLLFGALLGPSSAHAGSNDTMGGAQGPLTTGVQGSIATVNDVDWYFIYASAFTQLDAAITGLGPEDSCQDWNLVLTNSEGRELESVSAGFNHVRHILYTLQTPGTYYLEVTGFYCEAVGNYRVDLAASPSLLSSPPYVPPPTGKDSYAAACRRTQQRISSLSNRLRYARSRRQRKQLRAQLRRARHEARTYC